MAIRPATLTAATVPVLIGSAVAEAQDSVRWGVLVAALLGAVLIQIGTNFANDVFDFERGADSEGRLGPPRVTQMGLMSPGMVRRAMAGAFLLATACGVYLVVVGGWPIVVVGLASIVAGITYTGGPWPTGYHGLGDVICFAFFGVVAVVTTYYLHTDEVTGLAVAASIPAGCLVTAIIVVNNLRDRARDKVSGKTTLAVLLGDRLTRTEYVLLVSGAYVTAVVLAATESWWLLLPLLSLPLAVRCATPIVRGVEGRPLNLTLKATSRVYLVFGLLFAIGFLP